MLKKLQKKQISLIAGAGLCAFLAGGMLAAPQIGKMVGNLIRPIPSQPEKLTTESVAKSAVLPLVLQSPEERAAKLESIAKGSPSLDRNRARYILASDLIERKEAKKALELLDGLERDYPLLAPYVILRQAQAYDLLDQSTKASDKRQAVIRDYPKHPATAKALYLIGAKEYQDKAIADFPSNPLTWEIIRQRLQEDPTQSRLRVILVRHAYDQPGFARSLELLATDPTLKPEEHEIVGNAFWDNSEFGKASLAFAKAPRTPRNLYRYGRGLQVTGQNEQAREIYQQVVKAFPDTLEAGTALLRLAEIAEGKNSIPFLDQIVAKYPDKAGAALKKKAEILKAQGDSNGSEKAMQELITKFNNTEEAAEHRWKVAEEKAKAKKFQEAWQWAEPIPKNNPTSIISPRAGFWVGKWAQRLGKNKEAEQAFKFVISEFPYSYYSWRSAGMLGLNVGDFNTVRDLQPEIIPLQRPLPPAGSDSFKELYLLGQERDAWLQWQTEFINKAQPTVAEQFTEGLMRLAQGQNLTGIAKISKLEDRETPQEQADYQALSKQLTYWQARYPFPYFNEIKKWSTERKLNPLMVTALMRQESKFERQIKSTVGATGLMQIMPATAKWIAPQINLDKYDLEDPNDNIKMGTWYLDHTHDQYNGNSMLAIASYNAGPGNVSKWLKSIPKDDPDQFVEDIPFDETKNYVRQVLGNYWNYLRLYNPQMSQLVAQYSKEHPQIPQQASEPTQPQKPPQ